MKKEHSVGFKEFVMKTSNIQPDNPTQGVGPDEKNLERKENHSSDRFEGDVSWGKSDAVENVDHKPDGNTIDSAELYENWFWGGIDRE